MNAEPRREILSGGPKIDIGLFGLIYQGRSRKLGKDQKIKKVFSKFWPEIRTVTNWVPMLSLGCA